MDLHEYSTAFSSRQRRLSNPFDAADSFRRRPRSAVGQGETVSSSTAIVTRSRSGSPPPPRSRGGSRPGSALGRRASSASPPSRSSRGGSRPSSATAVIRRRNRPGSAHSTQSSVGSISGHRHVGASETEVPGRYELSLEDAYDSARQWQYTVNQAFNTRKFEQCIMYIDKIDAPEEPILATLRATCHFYIWSECESDDPIVRHEVAQDALGALEAALRFPEVRSQRGDVFLRISYIHLTYNSTSTALQVLRLGITSLQNDALADVSVQAASILKHVGNMTQALEYYEDLANYTGFTYIRSYLCHLQSARIRLELRDTGRAIPHILEAFRQHQSVIPSAQRAALELPAALAWFRDPSLWHEQAQALLKTPFVLLAEDLFWQGYRCDSGDARGLAGVANCLRITGRGTNTVGMLVQAHKLEPWNNDVRVSLSKASPQWNSFFQHQALCAAYIQSAVRRFLARCRWPELREKLEDNRIVTQFLLDILHKHLEKRRLIILRRDLQGWREIRWKIRIERDECATQIQLAWRTAKAWRKFKPLHDRHRRAAQVYTVIAERNYYNIQRRTLEHWYGQIMRKFRQQEFPVLYDFLRACQFHQSMGFMLRAAKLQTRVNRRIRRQVLTIWKDEYEASRLERSAEAIQRVLRGRKVRTQMAEEMERHRHVIEQLRKVVLVFDMEFLRTILHEWKGVLHRRKLREQVERAQRFVRQWLARRHVAAQLAYRRRLDERRAAAKGRFANKYTRDVFDEWREVRYARLIQRAFHRIVAMRRVARRRLIMEAVQTMWAKQARRTSYRFFLRWQQFRTKIKREKRRAAIKVQCGYRCHLARLAYARREVEYAYEQKQFARATVQFQGAAKTRGVRALARLVIEREASTMLQRVWRGVLGRRETQAYRDHVRRIELAIFESRERRMERLKRRGFDGIILDGRQTKAARLLQNTGRKYMERMYADWLRSRKRLLTDFSLHLIHRGNRFMFRLFFEIWLQVTIEDRCAAILQREMRGHLGRQIFRRYCARCHVVAGQYSEQVIGQELHLATKRHRIVAAARIKLGRLHLARLKNKSRLVEDRGHHAERILDRMLMRRTVHAWQNAQLRYAGAAAAVQRIVRGWLARRWKIRNYYSLRAVKRKIAAMRARRRLYILHRSFSAIATPMTERYVDYVVTTVSDRAQLDLADFPPTRSKALDMRRAVPPLRDTTDFMSKAFYTQRQLVQTSGLLVYEPGQLTVLERGRLMREYAKTVIVPYATEATVMELLSLYTGQRLVLTNGRLPAEAARLLFELGTYTGFPLHISFCDCVLGSATAKLAAVHLCHPRCGLKRLSLANSSICEAGVAALFCSLRANQSLEELSLTGLPFPTNDSVLRFMANCASVNTTLQDLLLVECNYISRAFMGALESFVRSQSCGLVRLVVTNCPGHPNRVVTHEDTQPLHADAVQYDETVEPDPETVADYNILESQEEADSAKALFSRTSATNTNAASTTPGPDGIVRPTSAPAAASSPAASLSSASVPDAAGDDEQRRSEGTRMRERMRVERELAAELEFELDAESKSAQKRPPDPDGVAETEGVELPTRPNPALASSFSSSLSSSSDAQRAVSAVFVQTAIASALTKARTQT